MARPSSPDPSHRADGGRLTKRAVLTRWLAEHRPDRIGAVEYQALMEVLEQQTGGVSRGYLRRLLRECGTELDPLVEGVRQEDFDALERSLVALAAAYGEVDGTRREAARRLVIEAKDHARWAARRLRQRADLEREGFGEAQSGEEPSGKSEMVTWMLTWLDNPPLFPEWVKLRRRVAAGREAGTSDDGDA